MTPSNTLERSPTFMRSQRWKKDQILGLFPDRERRCSASCGLSGPSAQDKPCLMFSSRLSRAWLRPGIKSRVSLFVFKVTSCGLEPPHLNLRTPQAQSSSSALYEARESSLLLFLFTIYFLLIPVIIYSPSWLARLQFSCGTDKVLSKVFARCYNELGVTGGVSRRALLYSLQWPMYFLQAGGSMPCAGSE